MTYRPTVRARRLARELRRLREQQGLTLHEVTTRFGWSKSRLSRIETNQLRPHHGDVADLLDLYGATPAEREALIALAREARRRGWWTAYQDIFSGTYLSLEDEASKIRAWDAQLIHGLLQTEEYAKAIIEIHETLVNDRESERRIAARKARQSLLSRENPPQLHLILDEAVLHRSIGGPKVWRDQLLALVSHASRPNITIQILPYTAEQHLGLDGRFTLMSYPDAADPEIAYIEGTMGDVYLESPDAVAQHGQRFDQIRANALSPQESIDLIGEAAKERS
jgi:transcriptional regulator with XRE-family HTH domain